jgi:hypothetical protein
MRVRITIEDGTLVYDSDVDRFPFRIGRKIPSEVVISASGVSSQHAEIFRDEKGSFFLRDMGSRNGTYRNGEKLSVVPIEFPFSFSLGKKVQVELIEKAVNEETPATYIVDSKTARIANLSKRKELVAKMKKKLPFEQQFYAPDLSKTLLGRLQSSPMVTILYIFIAFIFIQFGFDWTFTRGALHTLFMDAVFDFGVVLLVSLFISLPASVLFFLLKNGWMFRGPILGVFSVAAVLKIYYEFFYPFLISDLFGAVALLFSVGLFFLLSIFLFSLLFRGIFPKLSAFYFHLLVVFVSFGLVSSTTSFLWEKKQGGAYVDLFKRAEAPSRILAGIAVSPQQFKIEMKQLKSKRSSDKSE